MGSFGSEIVTATAVGLACAVLSVFVILRKWALVGDGISHSALGGAGTAWLLAVAWPASDLLWVQYAAAVLSCLVAAGAIGWLSYRERVSTDAAIGIFLAASVAWGILGGQVYRNRLHRDPAAWENMLLGVMRDASPALALTAVMVSVAVLLVVWGLWKEILAYCYDPAQAEASGVRAKLIHYLLLVLIAVVTVTGMRVAGSILAPALLVLPGAAAMRWTDNLATAIGLSVVFGVSASVGGILIAHAWPTIPEGPAIVLLLFAAFVVSLAMTPRTA